MPDDLYLYLDFDDTLSDFRQLGELYAAELARRLYGEFGGTTQAWSAALIPELAASIARYTQKFTGDPLAGFNVWLREERPRVVADIFSRAGVKIPMAASAGDLGLRLQTDALSACNASFPGAKDALMALSEFGVGIHMASSQESAYLSAALVGAGMDGIVGMRFGPDLLDCAKEGAEFYRRIFQKCGVRPSQAIVVDDQPQCLDWAEEAGARVVQACVKPDPAEPEFPIVLRNLADLPRLIRMGLT